MPAQATLDSPVPGQPVLVIRQIAEDIPVGTVGTVLTAPANGRIHVALEGGTGRTRCDLVWRVVKPDDFAPPPQPAPVTPATDKRDFVL